MSLTPQLPPTDFAKLEAIEDRGEREKALKENWIFRHEEPQGTRYTKGLHPQSTKRSWQSLDAVLRSNAASAEALPYKELRRSRIFAALTAVTGFLFIASGAATAREGFDFRKMNGANAVMLTSVLATVAFAITAGMFFRKAEKGYKDAVNIYNDSLGLRLGLLDANGDYIPGPDVAVDEEGYILTEDATTRVEGPVPAPPVQSGTPAPQPAPAPQTGAQPQPMPMPQPIPPPEPAPPPGAAVSPQTTQAAPGLRSPMPPRRQPQPAPGRPLALLPGR